MNDAALLELWETAWPLPPLQRARWLAQAAGAADGAGLGACNAALLRLRSSFCGPTLPLLASCPACATELEFEVDTRALPATSAGAALHELTLGDTWVRFRAPTADDLGLLTPADTPGAAARALFERCVVEAGIAGQPLPAAALSADVQQAVAQALDAADPLASLEFDLACPACERPFAAPLDVAGVTYAELRHRAEAVLADVAALAQAYGWRESDVLALSPLRRAAYLQLAGAAG